jgi:hypothetical protein
LKGDDANELIEFGRRKIIVPKSDPTFIEAAFKSH